MKKEALFVCILTLLCLCASAQKKVILSQDDSLIQESKDTILLKSYADRYSPRKALMFAAVVPGLGQVYNKKYWKLPLVYGGFISIGYAIDFYQDGYKEYKVYLYDNIENNLGESDLNPDVGYSTSQLRSIVNSYKRQRDFWMLMMGGMYLLQIIDAHVDAHLKEFDLNPRLQVSIFPSAEQNDLIGRQAGVSLIIKF
ncbi:MAG: hypothetical protein JNM57_01900 [Cyclobacteriaceae bacterium]|nr:hypothetical protein [Cyclobacteriaceae bacterium]